jgi:two-component system sensor kinase FixL
LIWFFLGCALGASLAVAWYAITRIDLDRAAARSAELDAILDAAVDGIVTIDAAGRITGANRAAEDMFGMPADGMKGNNVSMLMPAKDAGQHDQYISAYLATGKRKIIGIGRELTATRRDGDTFPIHLAIGEVSRGRGDTRFVGIIRDLTREKNQRKSAESMAQILEESLSELYVIDAGNLRLRFADKSALANTGYDRTELETLSPTDLFCDMTPRAFERLVEPLRNGGKKARNFQTHLRRSNGSRYPVDVHLFTGEYDGQRVLIASAMDVTVQQETADALRQRDEQYEVTLERAPLGIVSSNANGRIIEANAAAARILGMSQLDLIGRKAIRFFAPDERRGALRMLQHLTRGEVASSDSTHYIRLDSGEERIVKTNNAVVHDRHGRIDKIVAVFQDITESRAQELEIQQQRERIAHIGRLGTLGEMAAGLAHELNQPLAAISSFARGAKRFLDKPDTPIAEVQRAIERIDEQAHRAGEVIRRMRAMAKGESHAMSRVDCNAIIQDLMPLIEIDTRDSDTNLRLDLAIGLPEVSADTVQIQQVVLNLVRNAIDAMIEDASAPRNMTIRTRADEGFVHLSVIDSGPGVPAAIEQDLFNPFFSTKKSGMGMGLAISRSIIAAHKGTIRYHREPADKSSFTVSLPVAKSVERSVDQKESV